MYVVRVFMEAMVSSLIHSENISHFSNQCCLSHFTALSARVKMGHVCPSFIGNPMMPLFCICFSLCFAMHLIDCISVVVSCMILHEAMCFFKPLYRDCASMVSMYVHDDTHNLSVHGI